MLDIFLFHEEPSSTTTFDPFPNIVLPMPFDTAADSQSPSSATLPLSDDDLPSTGGSVSTAPVKATPTADDSTADLHSSSYFG